MLDDPNNPLGAITWQRGAWLGMVIVFLFAAGAGVLFLLTLLLGMEAKIGALLALLAGPCLGGVIFFLYWIIKRPKINTIEPHENEK